MVRSTGRSPCRMPAHARAAGDLPVIVVTGMAFEARIARGEGVEVVCAARADLLERALSAAVARGCSGIVELPERRAVSRGTEAGRAWLSRTRSSGPFGRLPTDAAHWPTGSPPRSEPRRSRRPCGAVQWPRVAAPLMSADDKRALHRSTGALAVDMESHLAGAVAAARGLPFAVCRAIVDPAWRTLPRRDCRTARRRQYRPCADCACELLAAAVAHWRADQVADTMLAPARVRVVQARHALGAARALDTCAWLDGER